MYPWASFFKKNEQDCWDLVAGRARRSEEGWGGQVFSQSPGAGFHTTD